MKLLIHSQTWTVAPLKFGNGYVISYLILLGIWLLVHAGLTLNPVKKMGPRNKERIICHDVIMQYWEYLALYTPGQKFIELFFNELLHQDNGRNQQFVNLGMETHHISTKLWNVIGVGAMATVQCR